ncbi:MAG: PucR family transcriptional regulator [Pseudolysinimonas sp.]
MKPSISALIAQSPLGLRSLVDGSAAGLEIEWVASSDLPDPTPFLDPGQLLVTTGRQFAEFDVADYVNYVDRLVAAKIVGIGFGTEVFREGTPTELVEACQMAGLALFEVPYRTPFLALIRWVSAQIAREHRRRDEWGLDAIRAISSSVLTGRVEAALDELARRVDGSVLLTERTGHTVEAFGRDLFAESVVVVDAEATRLLAAGKRGGRDLQTPDGVASLQTVGRGGSLTGILAIVTAERPDAIARLVANTVVALLEVAGEQVDKQLAVASRLADQSLADAMDGRFDTMRAVMGILGRDLPEGPLVVSAQSLPELRAHRRAKQRALEAGWPTGSIEDVLIVIANEAAWASSGAAREGERVGVARGLGWSRLAAGVERAQISLRRSTDTSPTATWGEYSVGALAEITSSDTVVAIAQTMLSNASPELVELARVWLAHDGQWDSAARSLGVHRHSLKDRMRQLGRLIDLDLETLNGKAELLVLIRSVDRAQANLPPRQ